MRRLIGTLGTAISLHTLAGPALSQDFDCSKAKALTEQTICASATLRELDEPLGVQYGYARRFQPSEEEEQRLIRQQRAWIKVRNQCGTDSSCLEATYRKRIKILEDQTGTDANQ